MVSEFSFGAFLLKIKNKLLSVEVFRIDEKIHERLVLRK